MAAPSSFAIDPSQNIPIEEEALDCFLLGKKMARRGRGDCAFQIKMLPVLI
jgi:hypothetical protein